MVSSFKQEQVELLQNLQVCYFTTESLFHVKISLKKSTK